MPISLPVCDRRGVQFIETGTVEPSPARRKNSQSWTPSRP
jgi:hypothetical protein